MPENIQGHRKGLQNHLWKDALNKTMRYLQCWWGRIICASASKNSLQSKRVTKRGEGRRKARKPQVHKNPQKLCSLWTHNDCYRTDSYIHVTNDAFNYKALISCLLSANSLWQKAKNLVNTNINYHIVLLYRYAQEKEKKTTTQQSA